MKRDTPFRIWLGSWEVKQRRINALEMLARKYAGTTRRGADDGEKGNISKFIQMIADGKLTISKKQINNDS